jgi:periplasmic protein TonB
MHLEPTGVPERVIGSLKSCLVEGDPEQQRRQRKIRRRALVASITLQTSVVVALVLFPLLGKSERITYEQRILPPYAPVRSVRGETANVKPLSGNKKICIVCVNLRTRLNPVKPGETGNTTLSDPAGDSLPGSLPVPGVPGGIDLSHSSKLPEPPKDRTIEPTQRMRMTTIEPAMLTHRVEPVYPTLAKQTGREGHVELHAIISTDGSIQSLEVLSGDPLFYLSALAAVRAWRYRPTYLNGQAVEIDTHISVLYKLNR